MLSKNDNKKMLKAIVIAIVLLPLAGACFAGDDYVLVVKPSPSDAGVVSQSVPQGGIASISATPQNGYQFVYWLGDVSDPTSATTTVATDSPKLVIAVYERSDYDFEIQLGGAGGLLLPYSNGQGGEGGVAPSVTTGVAPSAPGAKRYSRHSYSFPDITDVTDNTDEEGGFVPDEPIPEPSTIALFALGSIALTKIRRKSN